MSTFIRTNLCRNVVKDGLVLGKSDLGAPLCGAAVCRIVASRTAFSRNTDLSALGFGFGIAGDLTQFYSSKYPQLYNAPGQPIKAAVTEVQQIYSNTIFPYMKVDWRTHPANIGHFYFPGCFRCHDGNHVSADGKVITKNCTACHTVLSEVESGAPMIGSTEGVLFKHPVDIGDLSQVSCSDCHTGGTGP